MLDMHNRPLEVGSVVMVMADCMNKGRVGRVMKIAPDWQKATRMHALVADSEDLILRRWGSWCYSHELALVQQEAKEGGNADSAPTSPA
jgi:hypothetical protein